MAFRHNVVANYASQFYVTLIGIVMVPVYLRYLGAEAYGLVGFFTMMQAWFQLLDLGLSPTLARETARYKGGAVTALELRRLLRALECFFLVTAGIGALAVLLCSDWIAAHWLQARELPIAQVQSAVMLMGLTVPLRWTAGLYRGAVNGFEKQTWLAGFNVLIASGRFIGVVPVLAFVGSEPVVFFTYQLVIVGIEVIALIAMTYHLVPRLLPGVRVGLSVDPLVHVLRFSGVVAVTGFIWVLITQMDKLLLSKLVPLAEYGYYTLAVAVANGINVLSTPIAQPLMPRLARLYAEGKDQEALRLYRTATRAVSAVVVPAVLLLAVFSEEVLWTWTGDRNAAHRAAPILTLYAVGNGALAFAAFAYYLQYGQGRLRMHLLGNIILVVLLVPLVAWASMAYGTLGAASTWSAGMLLYLAIWVPLTHRRVAPGLHVSWMLRDIIPPLAAGAVIAYFAAGLPLPMQDRSQCAVVIILTGAALLLGSALLASIGHHLERKRIVQ